MNLVDFFLFFLKSLRFRESHFLINYLSRFQECRRRLRTFLRLLFLGGIFSSGVLVPLRLTWFRPKSSWSQGMIQHGSRIPKSYMPLPDLYTMYFKNNCLQKDPKPLHPIKFHHREPLVVRWFRTFDFNAKLQFCPWLTLRYFSYSILCWIPFFPLILNPFKTLCCCLLGWSNPRPLGAKWQLFVSEFLQISLNCARFWNKPVWITRGFYARQWDDAGNEFAQAFKSETRKCDVCGLGLAAKSYFGEGNRIHLHADWQKLHSSLLKPVSVENLGEWAFSWSGKLCGSS